MTSWVVWAVTVAVAVLIGFTATHFSVRTLRYVTAGTVIVLLVAVTAYGQTPAGGKVPPDLETAFAFGADRLSAAWFRPLWALWSSRHTTAPGRLGWSVIAVVLLLGYRLAEKWALRRQAPQLDTSKLTDGQPSIAGDGPGDGSASGPTAGQWHEWLAAEVKFRLAAVDVYAPPVLPGGTRSDGIASIAEASGVSGAGLAGAIIRFAGALWPTPRRYELRVWVEGAPRGEARQVQGTRRAITQTRAAVRAIGRGGAGRVGRAPVIPARVTVEIDEPRTGGTVASKTIVAASIDDAASMVAGYVARQIFVRDPASPVWCYGAADGRDLGALLLARQERVYVESAEDVQASRLRQIELLLNVTGADRCAGVVRYELAQLEDLERDQLAALRLHAMNREQYPRFFRGTYRLCMSLEMIADPEYPDLLPGLGAGHPRRDPRHPLPGRADRHRQVRAERHPRQGRVRTTRGTGPARAVARTARDAADAARRELRMIRRQLSLPVIVWNTFWRRDERTVWSPHWRITRRQEFRDGVCVAELLVAVKHRLNERYLVEKERALASAPPGDQRRSRRRGQRTGRGAGLRRAAVAAQGAARRVGDRGNSSAVRTVLREPFDAWPAGHSNVGQDAASTGRAGPDLPAEAIPEAVARSGWVPPTRDRVRWLPWQARTASWQAAYNTACLYAVLVQQGLADEDQVVASLRRVVVNRDSGMERPHDWISNDPDFAPLLREDSPYPMVRAFLEAQERRDYPVEADLRPAAGRPPGCPGLRYSRMTIGRDFLFSDPKLPGVFSRPVADGARGGLWWRGSCGKLQVISSPLQGRGEV